MGVMTDAVHSVEFLVEGAPQRHAGYARLRSGGPVHRVTLLSGRP